MALCTNISKFFLTVINLLFWVIGIGLIFLGSWMFSKYVGYGQGLLSLTTALLPALILLVVGILSCLLGLVGCVATFKEQKCITGLYFALLLIIFFGLVTGGALSFIYSKYIDEDLREVMTDGMKNYLQSEDAHAEVDLIQENVMCCGVDNYTDWIETDWYRNQSDPSIRYPQSCCAQLNCTYSLNDTHLHPEGCYSKLKVLLKSHLITVASVGCGLAGIFLIGMICTCVLLLAKRQRTQEIRYIGIPDPDGLRV